MNGKKNCRFNSSLMLKLYNSCNNITEKTLLSNIIKYKEKEAARVLLIKYLLKKIANDNMKDSYSENP